MIEFFRILLQIIISIINHIMNNGFHTTALKLSTCYIELISLLSYKINDLHMYIRAFRIVNTSYVGYHCRDISRLLLMSKHTTFITQ